MIRPQVDVGVVCWNTAELTAEALRRLIDSDQQCELRVLVHDNASTDGTADILARRVPEAVVEVSPDNLGFAGGINRLLTRSDAPWFFALNSDAWPEPGAIGALVAAAERHQRAAAVAPLLLRPDGTIEHSTHPFPSLKVALVDALGGRHWMSTGLLGGLFLEGAWRHDRPRRVDWAVGAALLLRRAALTEIGALDERFFMYVEDLEWCWRARRRGWEVRFEPAAVVRHVGNASGSRRWGSQRAGLEAANLRIFLREALGPTGAATYRALQAVAAGEQLVLARRRGQAELATHWRIQLKAHLGLAAPPVVRAATEEQAPPPTIDDQMPKLAVVVPTHDRSHLLVRLVAALESQSLDPATFEVVVVDDASTDETPAVLDKLASDSSLQLTVLHNQTSRGPAAARNKAWRSTSAPIVAFTDDDCVPAPDWLRVGLETHGRGNRVVVGRTEPPADQLPITGQAFSRALRVESARLFETCNVFYRRSDLEAVGGFDERFRRPSGEDTHLGLNVAALGVEAVFAPDAVVYHDVRPGDWMATIRETLRWVDLPLVVAGRPWVRSGLVHRWIFWKPTHPPAVLAAAGLLLGMRWRPALWLVVPWLRIRLAKDPVCPGMTGRVRWLPAALAVDLCEVYVMARGSLRHRTVVL